MCRNIVQSLNEIMPAPDYTTIRDNHRADRHLIQFKRLTRLCQGIPHKEIVVEQHYAKVRSV